MSAVLSAVLCAEVLSKTLSEVEGKQSPEPAEGRSRRTKAEDFAKEEALAKAEA